MSSGRRPSLRVFGTRVQDKNPAECSLGENWSRSSEERVYQSRAGGLEGGIYTLVGVVVRGGGVKPSLLYIQTPPLEAQLEERSRENPLRAGDSTNPPTNNRLAAVTPISRPPNTRHVTPSPLRQHSFQGSRLEET